MSVHSYKMRIFKVDKKPLTVFDFSNEEQKLVQGDR